MTKYEKIFIYSLLKKFKINLIGILSAENGSDLYLKCKEILIAPSIILFDLEWLDFIDSIGWEYLKKLKNLAFKKEINIHVCNLNDKWSDEWKAVWGEYAKSHDTVQEAIAFIDQLDLCIAEKSSTPDNLTHSSSSNLFDTPNILTDARIPTQNLSIDRYTDRIPHYCPHCGVIQFSFASGFISCTQCSGSYALYKNGIVSEYEKLT